ncbi:hypothetical protein XENOCAPTIV_021093 [Xenoophorus captivus]|uniref:Uncharacterized protein n=1 Tax=Xenoophorus captivus TaxID=1517983 RepID=A0ABV0RIJ1_9TELE
MDSPSPGTPTISVSCHPRTWTPSESDDDILNTPFIAETSPPPVIRQVSRRSHLRSLIIDHQSQLHSTTPSPWPQPEIDSLHSSKSKAHGCIALRSERSTCSLSQHRHSPTDAAVASMLQGSSAASTQLDIKNRTVARLQHALKEKGIPFSRCDNKSRLFQLLTTPSSPAAVSIPPGLPDSSSTSASSMNVSGNVTAQLASRPEPISTAPPSGNQVVFPLCLLPLCLSCLSSSPLLFHKIQSFIHPSLLVPFVLQHKFQCLLPFKLLNLFSHVRSLIHPLSWLLFTHLSLLVLGFLLHFLLLFSFHPPNLNPPLSLPGFQICFLITILLIPLPLQFHPTTTFIYSSPFHCFSHFTSINPSR